MPDFGSKSLERLATLHPKLQNILMMAIDIQDFTIVWGFRGEQAQNEAYDTGHSDRPWPQSLHNQQPSRAVDVAPWPIKWNDTDAFIYLAGVIMTCAYTQDVKLRWGGRWKTLKDWGHFELEEGE